MRRRCIGIRDIILKRKFYVKRKGTDIYKRMCKEEEEGWLMKVGKIHYVSIIFLPSEMSPNA